MLALPLSQVPTRYYLGTGANSGTGTATNINTGHGSGTGTGTRESWNLESNAGQRQLQSGCMLQICKKIFGEDAHSSLIPACLQREMQIESFSAGCARIMNFLRAHVMNELGTKPE